MPATNTAATATDLAAANLLTPARAIMLAHGLTLRINADGSVDFSGDDTEEMYAEIEAAERCAERCAEPADAKPTSSHDIYCLDYMMRH